MSATVRGPAARHAPPWMTSTMPAGRPRGTVHVTRVRPRAGSETASTALATVAATPAATRMRRTTRIIDRREVGCQPRDARMRTMASDRDLAQRAVRAGAAAVQRTAGGDLEVRRKTSAADLVSAADHASEEAIVALLAAERPDDAIVGEEGASVGAGSRRWLVDGLDGTVNFLRAIPQWCVAVVLEDDGEPLATAVLDPVRGQLFSA